MQSGLLRIKHTGESDLVKEEAFVTHTLQYNEILCISQLIRGLSQSITKQFISQSV